MIKNLFSSVQAVIALLSLIPQIRSLIHEVETPGVSGADKKSAVLKMLSSTVQFVNLTLKLSLPTETILNYAGVIIDVVVDIDNAFHRLLPHVAPVVTGSSALKTKPASTVEPVELPTATISADGPPPSDVTAASGFENPGAV